MWPAGVQGYALGRVITKYLWSYIIKTSSYLVSTKSSRSNFDLRGRPWHRSRASPLIFHVQDRTLYMARMFTLEAAQIAGQSEELFAQRRVRIEEEGLLQVEPGVAAVVELIEDDVVGLVQSVEARAQSHGKQKNGKKVEVASHLQRGQIRHGRSLDGGRRTFRRLAAGLFGLWTAAGRRLVVGSSVVASELIGTGLRNRFTITLKEFNNFKIEETLLWWPGTLVNELSCWMICIWKWKKKTFKAKVPVACRVFEYFFSQQKSALSFLYSFLLLLLIPTIRYVRLPGGRGQGRNEHVLQRFKDESSATHGHIFYTGAVKMREKKRRLNTSTLREVTWQSRPKLLVFQSVLIKRWEGLIRNSRRRFLVIMKGNRVNKIDFILKRRLSRHCRAIFLIRSVCKCNEWKGRVQWPNAGNFGY